VRTPPADLAEAEIAMLIADAWQFSSADLAYAPVGFGSHHWVATDASGSRRFVTVDALADKGEDPDAAFTRLERAMRTASFLRESAGLCFVVAPILTADGAALRRVGHGFAAAVFPYVEGVSYPEVASWTGRDRTAVVELLAQLHAATPTVHDVAGVHDLKLVGRSYLERALGRLDEPWDSGPYGEATRALLTGAAADLRALLRTFDRLADAARTSTDPWVITHGEPKPDNIMSTEAGPVLYDWDTALIAPAARDLWMVDGISSEASAAYTELTGRVVSREQLLLYRLGWDLADIASFVGWFSAPHARTADTEIAWNALSRSLRLQELWPELL
jgi:aminoglycoside phosphotransferase (APT) family kinase protein